ncbi:hypothetical protein BASA81_001475 [Batrachochytrium salamandrivorans]|nr:hypothetical protein BASA81_001475 [Batrachochytrium salamandrivorans]
MKFLQSLFKKRSGSDSGGNSLLENEDAKLNHNPVAPSTTTSAASTANNTPRTSVEPSTTRKDRLLSCPDRHHHAESEMLSGIARVLTEMMLPKSPPVAIMPPHKQEWALYFDAASLPPISLQDYLSRLVFYLGNIPEYSSDKAMHSDLAVRYLLGAILYLERIELFAPGFTITELNIHRLLITGVLITAKVLDDVEPDHKYYAQLGGVSVSELVKLEIAMLQLCEYNVNIDPIDFAAKYAFGLMQRDHAFTDENALFGGALLSPAIARAPPPSLEDII